MITENEETYYERMKSTMTDKCLTLLPYLFEGVKVLDFGVGKDLSIDKLVKGFNGKYIAVDNSTQVQEYFEKNGILCFNSLDDVNETVDVIFLSSVYHELLSYLTSLEITSIIKKFSQLIGNDGKIVIRDWNILNIEEWHKKDEIVINKENYLEIKKWIIALKEKGIIENNNTLEFTNDSIKGCRNDLYNILYHTTWGIDSLPRESRENYAITLDSILRYFYNNDLEITEKVVKWDDTYIKYINKYFISYGDRVKNEEEWLSPKVRITLQKRKKY